MLVEQATHAQQMISRAAEEVRSQIQHATVFLPWIADLVPSALARRFEGLRRIRHATRSSRLIAGFEVSCAEPNAAPVNFARRSGCMLFMYLAHHN